MIEFALINKILIIFINIVAVWIGIATYQHDKKILNRIIPLMVIAMLCWVDFAYLARRIGTGNIHLASAFLKIAWFVTPLLFTLLYFLVIYLLEKAEEFSLLNKLVFVAGAGSAFLTGFTG